MIIKHNVQLKPYNSFRTKALAKLFCEPATLDELIEVIRTHPHEEKLLLGGGFNLFFTKDFDGLVIKPAMEMVETVFEDEQQVEIEVGAGMEWDALVETLRGPGLRGTGKPVTDSQHSGCMPRAEYRGVRCGGKRGDHPRESGEPEERRGRGF